MRGQCIGSVRAKTRCDPAHSRPIFCHGVPPFFELHRSRMKVTFHLGPCEKLRHYRKLATSSCHACGRSTPYSCVWSPPTRPDESVAIIADHLEVSPA